MDVKEDPLQCSPVELNQGLSEFVQEIVSPRGPCYRPDSVYYLCLGIQQVSSNQAYHTHSHQLKICKQEVFLEPKPSNWMDYFVFQYLLENSRMVNIFTDQLYDTFAKELNGILSEWLPLMTTNGRLTLTFHLKCL